MIYFLGLAPYISFSENNSSSCGNPTEALLGFPSGRFEYGAKGPNRRPHGNKLCTERVCTDPVPVVNVTVNFPQTRTNFMSESKRSCVSKSDLSGWWAFGHAGKEEVLSLLDTDGPVLPELRRKLKVWAVHSEVTCGVGGGWVEMKNETFQREYNWDKSETSQNGSRQEGFDPHFANNMLLISTYHWVVYFFMCGTSIFTYFLLL